MMAVARARHVNPAVIRYLQRIAEHHTMPKTAREIKRALTRPGRSFELTPSELRTLHGSTALNGTKSRELLDGMMADLERAEAYERERDERVKPGIEARRAARIAELERLS